VFNGTDGKLTAYREEGKKSMKKRTGKFKILCTLALTGILWTAFFAGPALTVQASTADFRVSPPATGPRTGAMFIRNGCAQWHYYWNHVDWLTVANPDYGAVAETGSIWACSPVDLNQPFTVESYLYMYHNTLQPTTGTLADGITFTIQNDPCGKNYIGNTGPNLGVYGSGYVKNALSIEFDTYSDANDPKGGVGHVAVVKPAASVGLADHINVGYFTPGCRWIPLSVTWTPSGAGGKLSYSFDGKSYSYTVADCNAQFGGKTAWWGFTGSTNAKARQSNAVAMKTFPTQNPTYPITVYYYADSLSGRYLGSASLSAAQVGAAITDVDLYKFAPAGYATPGTRSGATVVAATTNIVYVVYSKAIQTATITVVHKDLENGSILWKDVLTVNAGPYGPYESFPFPNYETGVLVAGSAPASGTIGAGESITITYGYQKQKATIIVIHQSSTGAQLWRDDLTVDPGSYGPYSNYPYFDGYDIGRWLNTSDPVSGTINGGETKTIIFVYNLLV